jgi:hypothetical protein
LKGGEGKGREGGGNPHSQKGLEDLLRYYQDPNCSPEEGGENCIIKGMGRHSMLTQKWATLVSLKPKEDL